MPEEKDTALVAAVRELTKEFRRGRRWRMLFGIFPVLILFLIFVTVVSEEASVAQRHSEHTAQIDIFGLIVPLERSSAEFVTHSLRSAFEAEEAKAIVLRINSPGGSPVQADRIFSEVQRLRAAHPEKPVYAVVEDLCASAAYYIAVAADEIYVNPTSLVGSIGVISSSFGMVDLIDDLGIERRVTKSGRHKNMLDPFLPEDPEAQQHLQDLIDEVHQLFVRRVVESRGARLSANETDIFDGRIWTGAQARELGMVDGFADVGQVARDIAGVEDVVDYTYEPDFLEQMSDRIASRLGSLVENWLRTPTLY